jgi:hypothetical protein
MWVLRDWLVSVMRYIIAKEVKVMIVISKGSTIAPEAKATITASCCEDWTFNVASERHGN